MLQAVFYTLLKWNGLNTLYYMSNLAIDFISFHFVFICHLFQNPKITRGIERHDIFKS